MHGILDTSMGWVSNGVTGSQAFAAYDQGFDVWLSNSRANPPRVHVGARRAPSLFLGPGSTLLPGPFLRLLLRLQQVAHCAWVSDAGGA